jgi:hypothetical protein
MEILREHFMAIEDLPTNGLDQKPRYMSIIFPEIYGFIKNKKISSNIYLLTLNCLEKSYLPAATNEFFKSELLNDYKALIDFFSRLDYPVDNEPWFWDNDEYMSARYDAEIIADLLGYINGPEVVEVLKQSLAIRDVKIVMFVIIALLRHRQAVDEAYIEKVAANAETRSDFFNMLEQLGKTSLFPEKYLTHKKHSPNPIWSTGLFFPRN